MMSALVLVLLAQATPQRDARIAPAAPASGAIVGTVLSDDAQPRPLRRARVTVNGTLPGPRTVITSDDGAFRVTGLPAGRYTVTGVKDGYVTMDYGATRTARPGTWITVGDRPSAPVVLRLPRGAVITGTVTNIDGQPAPGIAVNALTQRYFFPTGERRYISAGVSGGTTDDRGTYRIFGLPAGDYVIAAQPQPRTAGLVTDEVRMMSGAAVADTRLILTQVFHPGTTEVGRAARLSVRAGEERAGIDVQLQYVPLAAVSGTVSVGPGWSPASIMIARTDEIAGFEPVRTARAGADGRFTIASVAPGTYRIMARTTPTAAMAPGSPPAVQTAMANVIVNGEDVGNVALAAHAGLTISGQIAFEGQAPAVTLPLSLRVPIPTTMTIANAGFTLPAVQIDGTRFKIEGIIPGPYRLSGNLQGIRSPIGTWWLKSFVVGGRDILDAPLDLQSSADDAVATFTDRVSEVSGVAADGQGTPVEDAFVVVFTTDRAGWFYNSRRIAGVRAGRDGGYSIRNLPPGEYRLLATRDLEQGEWFDPAVLERLLPVAVPVTIAGPEKQVRNLAVR